MPREAAEQAKRDGMWAGVLTVRKVKADHLFAKPVIDVLHGLHDGINSLIA